MYLPRHGLVQLLYDHKPILIQAKLVDNTWEMLVATMLCNVTRASVAIPIFFELMKRWPTPEAMVQAPVPDLEKLLKRIGLQSKRASRLILLSHAYLVDPPFQQDAGDPSPCTPKKRLDGSAYPPTAISHLPGVGAYALDSFRIFSSLLEGGGAPSKEEERLRELDNAFSDGVFTLPPHSAPYEEWKSVLPSDKELVKYLIWRWAIEGYEWNPIHGVVGHITVGYLKKWILAQIE